MFKWNYAKSLFRCCVVLLFAAAGVIANAQTNSLLVKSDTSSIRNPISYGKPNQSRLWYNSRQDRWDALVPRNDGGISQSDHYIMKDVSGNQMYTAVELEDRDFARPDVFWDDQNATLYVFASHPTQSQFWRVGYDAATDTYKIEVGVAGTGVAVCRITHPNDDFGGDSPASLYVTPNGNVWVAVMKDDGLEVQHSGDGGATWMAAPITLDGAARAGVTTWIDFVNRGTTFVGVFAAENGAPSVNTDFFFWYIDQNAEPAVLTNWINDTINIPQSIGVEQSDDHVSAARDAMGNLYFAVKTESGGPTDPLIKLYRRTPGGVWSQFEVTQTKEVPEQSRPSLVIDDENAEISVYVNGAEIVSSTVRAAGRFRARLDSLDDLALANAPFVPLFSKEGTVFTDVITPRHRINAASDVVVLAHNRTDRNVWISAEEIDAPATVTVPDVVGLFQSAAETTISAAGLVVDVVNTANSDTVSAGNVISQDPVGGTNVRAGSPFHLVVSLGPAGT